MKHKVREIESTAATIEEAIAKGLADLGLMREEVEIKVLDEGESGLFGLSGAKPARVLIQEKTKKNFSA